MSVVAAIQMRSSSSVADNLRLAQSLIAQAAHHGAVLAVLPEMFAVIGNSAVHQAKEPYGAGKIQDFLSKQARKNHLWIVGGTIPISCEDDSAKIRAASIVYNDSGERVARYDKIHLFDASISTQESYRESDRTQAGSQVVVVDTPFGKLGLAVCYDIRFPTMFTELLRLGAEFITIPAAFTLKTGASHWKLLARARAVETFCYVIGAAQEGYHGDGRWTYGHSLTVNPWGEIIEEVTESGSGIAYAQIDLQKLHNIRKLLPGQTILR